jgi:hypothetical protein
VALPSWFLLIGRLQRSRVHRRRAQNRHGWIRSTMDPTLRPRSPELAGAGSYLSPHRRRWSGGPKGGRCLRIAKGRRDFRQ